mmetsp:Transcript_42809/g.60023  ORF Transcript_42809/g.60023 Transcript_42809/m.60023 type:complete len:82 (+) Transcript_42809:63-308(+)
MMPNLLEWKEMKSSFFCLKIREDQVVANRFDLFERFLETHFHCRFAGLIKTPPPCSNTALYPLLLGASPPPSCSRHCPRGG